MKIFMFGSRSGGRARFPRGPHILLAMIKCCGGPTNRVDLLPELQSIITADKGVENIRVLEYFDLKIGLDGGH